MTKKEAFTKIKELLGFSEDTNFTNAKLTDGTILQWEGDLKEGTALSVMDSEGNITPAPDATHEIEDGTRVTTVGGLITAVEAKKMEETETEMQKMFAEFLTQFNEMKSEFTAVKEKLAGYDEKFTAMESANTETASKFSEIKEIITEIAEAPAAEIEAPKASSFKKEKPAMSVHDRIAEWKKSQSN